ncbi:MAG: hypothetical protein AAF220_06970 [Pseudomonadota bacterium]
MDFLTRFGLDKSRFTLLVMVLILLMGITSYFTLWQIEVPSVHTRSGAKLSGATGDSHLTWQVA